MTKRSLRTLLKDGLVGTIGIIGGYQISKFGYDLSQKIIENPKIQEIGGKILSNAIEYGPMALIGGIALYGVILAVDGTDKRALEKQITQYKKDVQRIQRNIKDAQEDIEDSQEYVGQLQEDMEKKHKNIGEIQKMISDEFPIDDVNEE